MCTSADPPLPPPCMKDHVAADLCRGITMKDSLAYIFLTSLLTARIPGAHTHTQRDTHLSSLLGLSNKISLNESRITTVISMVMSLLVKASVSSLVVKLEICNRRANLLIWLRLRWSQLNMISSHCLGCRKTSPDTACYLASTKPPTS